MSVERTSSTIWHAMRRLTRSPGFFALTAGTLALGLGASAALYSLVDGVLIRQLPFRDAAAIVRVQEIGERGPSRNMSQANFEDLAQGAGETAAGESTGAASRFAAMARYAVGVTTVAGGGREPARLPLAYVSRQFFSVFGVEPQNGRAFAADESRPGGVPVVLVSESVWRDVLGSPVDRANATLSFDGVTHAVIGVLPDSFDQPEGARVWAAAERLEPVASRTALNWRAVGRLRHVADLDAARGQLSGVARRLKQELGDATWMRDVSVTSLRDSIVGRASAALWLLLGAALFLLVVACANVANLLLARATARRREIAVRRALGAGGRDLFPQFLGETLGVALAGGLLGSLFAALLLRLLKTWAPGAVPRLQEATAGGLGWTTFAGIFAAVVLVAAVLAAVLTVWSSESSGASKSRSGSPALAGGRADTASRAKRRAEQTIAAGQMALAMTLLGVAALLGRSVQELLAVDPGYEIDGRILVEMEPPPIATPADFGARQRQLDTLREGLAARAGVRAVGLASSAPLTSAPANGTFLLVAPGERLGTIEDFARLSRLPGRSGEASYIAADAGYFAALDIPLLAGRGFEPRDTVDAPHVALISADLAARTWPGQDPLGRLLEFGNMDGDLRLLTVVGVVGDVRHVSFADDRTPIVYTNLEQRLGGARSLRIVVAPASSGAGASTAEGLSSATRAAVRAAAPELPSIVRPYTAVQAAAFLDRSFQLRLVSGFALGALLLATAAAAGVAALGVARRRRELGVRLAIGAAPRSLVTLVLGEQLRWLIASLAFGVVATWATGRLLRGQLWGVAPSDPWALAGAAMVLGLVVLAATAIPARRAASTDPVEALRSE